MISFASLAGILSQQSAVVPYPYTSDEWVTFGDSRVIADAADIVDCTSLREQDAIIHDPNDPNLGTYPEREYKCYFTAIVGTDRVYVTFSANGRTGWTTPVRCDMGTEDYQCEDPSVVTLVDTPGEVHRDGDGKMHLYAEKKDAPNASTIYVFESVDGITWTTMSSNPAIPLGTGWEDVLTGSPNGRHDGTNYIVGYEGITGTGSTVVESFGLAIGATANGLTKSSNNPVWRPLSEPIVNNSIVVDSMELIGDRWWFLGHDGALEDKIGPFRGYTTNLDPSTWATGDIVGVRGAFSNSLNGNPTGDFSVSDYSRVVYQPDDKQTIESYRLIPFAGDLPPTVPSHWWDFSDSGYVLTSSSAITAVIDKVCGFKLVDDGVATRPTLATENSRSVAQFDGGDFLQGIRDKKWDFLVDGTNFLVVVAFKAGTTANPNAAYNLMSTGTQVASRGRFILRYDDRSGLSRNNTVVAQVSENTTSCSTIVGANDTVSPNAWHVISAYMDPNNATASARGQVTVDGVELAATNSGTGTPATRASLPLQLSREGADGAYLVGSIGEVLIYRLGTDTISDTDRDAVVAWVAARHSVSV